MPVGIEVIAGEGVIIGSQHINALVRIRVRIVPVQDIAIRSAVEVNTAAGPGENVVAGQQIVLGTAQPDVCVRVGEGIIPCQGVIQGVGEINAVVLAETETISGKRIPGGTVQDHPHVTAAHGRAGERTARIRPVEGYAEFPGPVGAQVREFGVGYGEAGSIAGQVLDIRHVAHQVGARRPYQHVARQVGHQDRACGGKHPRLRQIRSGPGNIECPAGILYIRDSTGRRRPRPPAGSRADGYRIPDIPPLHRSGAIDMQHVLRFRDVVHGIGVRHLRRAMRRKIAAFVHDKPVLPGESAGSQHQVRGISRRDRRRLVAVVQPAAGINVQVAAHQRPA